MSKDYDLIHPHDRFSLLEFIKNEECNLKSSSARIKKLRTVYELKPLPQIVQIVNPEESIKLSYNPTYQTTVDITNDVIDKKDNILIPIKKNNIFKRLYTSFKKYSIKKKNQKYDEYDEEYLFYDDEFEDYENINYNYGKKKWYNSLFK